MENIYAQQIVGNRTIGEFVAEDFRAAEIFRKYGIDFCCGGKKSLVAACEEKGIDHDTIVQELEDARSSDSSANRDFASWPLPFLIDFIVNTHHAYLYDNLPTIAAYLHKIVEVHGGRHGELGPIATIFDRMAGQLEEHLREEEKFLFPMIKRIVELKKVGGRLQIQDAEALKESLATLWHEHEMVGASVEMIRKLSANYQVPADGCGTYVVCFRLLEEFEQDLHMHVHLENNILFPKAMLL